MRRKPLFPPPKDPVTHRSKHNKGRQDYTVLTVNGRVRLWRRRWHSPGEGTTTPLDEWDLLFRAASATLLTLSADAQRLGAQIGVTAILHTWGQNLLFHPHLHCVVTGGGLATDSSRWIATRPDYF